MKEGSSAYDYSAASELGNRKFIAEAIEDALLDGDAALEIPEFDRKESP
ncbi:MAG: hypothetical protein KA715_13765 [Xanthomonadaceae bacterium]|nr:hypothetical protein [Xanthomonadaceae bacterium]